MTQIVKFAPNVAAPTFTGRGSKIEHPDIQPIFWGPYWPGGGSVTSAAIMQAVRSITAGPYLSGLIQYGYSGQCSVRNEMYISSSPNIVLAPPGPGINQSATVGNAVFSLIDSLVDDDRIENVDDNHDLIVAVFLDPSVPIPQNMTGGVTLGANNSIEKFEFLDDNTRFEYCWIGTAGASAAAIAATFSHELVESITDPFNTGWTQTSPPPSAGQGQIADVCNQNGSSAGTGVVAYWSIADGACIIPTAGARRVSIVTSVQEIARKDGPTQQAFVDMGKLCGAGFFDYFDLTYHNRVVIRADVQGYESPFAQWTINGQTVPFFTGTLNLEATWEVAPASKYTVIQLHDPVARLLTMASSPGTLQVTADVGPDQGNVLLSISCSVSESFDTASAGGLGTSVIKRSTLLEVKNQELVWSEEYKRARKHCREIQGLADGPVTDFGPPRPGDPPDLAQIFVHLLQEFQ